MNAYRIEEILKGKFEPAEIDDEKDVVIYSMNRSHNHKVVKVKVFQRRIEISGDIHLYPSENIEKFARYVLEKTITEFSPSFQHQTFMKVNRDSFGWGKEPGWILEEGYSYAR